MSQAETERPLLSLINGISADQVAEPTENSGSRDVTEISIDLGKTSVSELPEELLITPETDLIETAEREIIRIQQLIAEAKQGDGNLVTYWYYMPLRYYHFVRGLEEFVEQSFDVVNSLVANVLRAKKYQIELKTGKIMKKHATEGSPIDYFEAQFNVRW